MLWHKQGGRPLSASSATGGRRMPSPRALTPGSIPHDAIKKPLGVRATMSRRVLPPKGLREINQELYDTHMQIMATFVNDDASQEEQRQDQGRLRRASVESAVSTSRRASCMDGAPPDAVDFSMTDGLPHAAGSSTSSPSRGNKASPVYGSVSPDMRSRIGAMSASPSPRMSPFHMHTAPPRLSPLQRRSPPVWRQPPSWPTSQLQTSSRPGSRASSQQVQVAAESAYRKRRIMAALYRHAYQSITQVERVVLPAGGKYGSAHPEESSATPRNASKSAGVGRQTSGGAGGGLAVDGSEGIGDDAVAQSSAEHGSSAAGGVAGEDTAE